jgi:hypothetical protein
MFKMHTAEPPVSEPSSCGVKIHIKKLKIYKSPVFHLIPVELIQAGSNTLQSEIYKRSHTKGGA